MSSPAKPALARRNFLGRAAGGAVAAVSTLAAVTTAGPAPAAATPVAAVPDAVPFHGPHQAGITTAMQQHTYFIAFDMNPGATRADLIRLLQAWTQAAQTMSGDPAQFEAQPDPQLPPQQNGAAVDLPTSHLTITFGFGTSLFEKNGVDRFGIAARRPEALADLPRFAGDQLVPERSGGDLSMQACADDPQVVEAVARRLATLAEGTATMRWAQMGFAGGFKAGETGRNQMGFKDGTLNPSTSDDQAMKQFIWVGDEGPAWLRGGSYMVIRPIRIALAHWDHMKLAFQEETVGRHKRSGAPIGQAHEHDPLALEATDKDGNPLTNENSHAAMSAPENNGGAQILRRAFNYDNGIAKVAERWPPWRQVVTFDAGLLFQCYQRDPRTGFSRLYAKMALVDMLNQFTTHVGSALFACPPGIAPGEYVGQRLFS